MITFFTIPKPFRGHIATIQKNAICSWTKLHPACEVILFGDEEGTADLADELGIRHVPEISRNNYGTPLVSDVFEKAQLLATCDILCYVNADIILLNSFIPAVERVANEKARFLMAGRRWNIDIDQPIRFDYEWENQVKDLLAKKGQLFTNDGMDYFVFRRNSIKNMPEFAVGRPAWDNWMIYYAVSLGFSVIDSTQVITPVHQNHGYSHVPQGTGQAWQGPEADCNRILAGGWAHISTLDDANYLLTKKYIIPRRCPTLIELPESLKLDWPWTEESAQLPNTMPNGSFWPKISIVTPSYNQASYLEETIRSVLLQGYPNLEYIIMDGGSTDGSLDIIKKYEPWLSHVHYGPDDGQSAAIATGFKLATGEILAWLNSDDRYLPNALGRVAQFFARNPNIVFGNGDVNFIDAEGRLIERIYAVRPNYTITASTAIHCWPQQGCFWRRWAYEKAGGLDSSLQFSMDLDLFIRLVIVGPAARIAGPPLADFRIHEKAKSSTLLDTGRHENEMIIARYGSPELRKIPRLLNIYWWFWTIPNRARSKVQRSFGWEL